MNMQVLIGIIFVSFLIVIREMQKSEIRRLYDGNFIRKNKKKKYRT